MRVGRSAIDEDAIRLLEQHNPDVQFDWTHILKSTPQAAPAEIVRLRGVDAGQSRGQRRKERRAFPRAADSAAFMQTLSEPAVEEPSFAQPAPEAIDQQDVAAAALEEIDEPGVSEDRLVPTDDELVVESDPQERPTAAFQRLGSEGLARLRARYAEVMARIAERPMDDAAREELKLRAERLNPDGWVTADEVQHALEQYENVFEGLRAIVGTRRRRRRRRGQGGRRTQDGNQPQNS